jgi:hypothetical protein
MSVSVVEPLWFVYGLTVRITGVFTEASMGMPLGRSTSAWSWVIPSADGK